MSAYRPPGFSDYSSDEVYRGDGFDRQAKPAPPKFDLIPFASIKFSTGARWLVKGLLASTGLAAIYGPPKQYKSFIAADLALHIAAGRDWAGRRVRQGTVVYIVAEGATGFADRIAANRQKFDLPDDLPFYLIKARPNLGIGQGDTPALIAAIEPVVAGVAMPLAAIFIDTLVRTLSGASENDEGMRNFTDNAETIADHFQCLAAAVHHTGKDVTRGMRGSSALPGAVVNSWFVEKTRPLQARITLDYAKDGESGLTWTADLERYVFGVDEDGDDEAVLIVCAVSDPIPDDQVTEPAATASKGRPIPAQLRLFVSCLDTAMVAAGLIGKPYLDGPDIRIVPLHAVRAEYFARRGDDASEDAKRKSFDNQVKSAIERKLINVESIGPEKVTWKTKPE